tara:strand:- start:4606 stop:5136 length:531 start_codon:yes stop_codon:yes gene_type:complete
MNSALFLDRDGVINVDYGYVHAKDNFVFNEEIFDLVSFANSKNFLVIVVTNQAGIGKGLYTEEDFNILTKWISEKFISNNGKIEKTYFCPFHEDANIHKYRKKSIDRKPSPGMIYKACKEFNINPQKSIIIGDKESDIRAGISANIAKCIYFGKDSCELAYKSVSSLSAIKEELIF